MTTDQIIIDELATLLFLGLREWGLGGKVDVARDGDEQRLVSDDLVALDEIGALDNVDCCAVSDGDTGQCVGCLNLVLNPLDVGVVGVVAAVVDVGGCGGVSVGGGGVTVDAKVVQLATTAIGLGLGGKVGVGGIVKVVVDDWNVWLSSCNVSKIIETVVVAATTIVGAISTTSHVGIVVETTIVASPSITGVEVKVVIGAATTSSATKVGIVDKGGGETVRRGREGVGWRRGRELLVALGLQTNLLLGVECVDPCLGLILHGRVEVMVTGAVIDHQTDTLAVVTRHSTERDGNVGQLKDTMHLLVRLVVVVDQRRECKTESTLLPETKTFALLFENTFVENTLGTHKTKVDVLIDWIVAQNNLWLWNHH
ncbi:hypothetical protein DFA_09671 [Cavenderia fasciculata]|uniref:Uncharacterized protein n=1 Tax=Cavenderia fasciculata TaxID=261658 RepID=F4Q899_CACFS|nr:uncharacterized protein DFA_09671 [Cavenderia fasciculata]EGG15999.1 hypothetical protein DFA_09671 [Cavenderia fasciculata]|eukprot:XP_004352324.1 hypothetical protein DFA_09671 [Cavenderia fasciculata]